MSSTSPQPSTTDDSSTSTEPLAPIPRHLVITGAMGVGKSTTAQAVVARTGLTWRDSDTDLERLFGVTGSVLADRHGVDELHRLEAAVLLGALASVEPTVISCAASIVEDVRCREALRRRAHVVVLEAPVDVVADRIVRGLHRRPMDRDEYLALQARRGPMFASIADLRLETTQPPNTLAATIVDRLIG